MYKYRSLLVYNLCQKDLRRERLLCLFWLIFVLNLDLISFDFWIGWQMPLISLNFYFSDGTSYGLFFFFLMSTFSNLIMILLYDLVCCYLVFFFSRYFLGLKLRVTCILLTFIWVANILCYCCLLFSYM